MAKQSQSEIDQMIQRSECKNRDLVRRDIIQVLQLSECNLVLTIIANRLNDGKSKEYLCLNGTVTCQYKGNRYNIPIEIILHENHPYEGPIARVKPTSNMYISTTNTDVQPDGTIIINYLRIWRHPSSDLSNLIKSMSQSFSQSPPVYSASNTNNQSTPYPINNSFMPMPMPMGRSSPYLHSDVYPSIEKQLPDNAYHESLKSAVFGKIQNRFNEIVEIEKGEISSLQKTEQDLNSGLNQIQLFIQQIQQQQIQIQNYMTNLSIKTNQISETTPSKKQTSLNDDLVIIRLPIYKQIFQLSIEDHAVEDLLYFLACKLRKNSISLDNYLKRVRQISRRQFILRATIVNCRQIAGLSTI